MSLVNGSVDGLLDGVSQEPDAMRLPSQAAEQINGWTSLTFGLLKRPPTRLVKKMVSLTPPTAYGNALVQTIRRSPADVHKVIIKNGDIEVYDALTGNATTLSKSDTAYLTTANPNKDIRTVTLGDTTFIVNRNTNVTRAPLRSLSINNNQALITVNSVDYSTVYAIQLANIGGAQFLSFDPNQVLYNAPGYVSWTTPSGDTAAARAEISSDIVAKNLLAQLNAGTFPNTGVAFTSLYSFSRINSTIVVTRNVDNYDFGIAVTDGLADTAISCIKHQVSTQADLPPVAPDGYLVQVVGDPTSALDNYWVTYNSQGTAQGQGTWIETVAPGIEVGLDATTMPHQLVETPIRTYFFKDGGVAPIINITDAYDAGHTQQWDGLTANQNLVITAQDGTGTVIFPAASGLQKKDALCTASFSLYTANLGVNDSVTVFLEKETAPASGVYTVVAQNTYLPGNTYLNGTLFGLIQMQNSTTYHARLRLHYNNSAGTPPCTLVGHSVAYGSGPGFSYKIITGTVVSTNYTVWPVSQAGDVGSDVTLSFDVSGIGNIALVSHSQTDDSVADLALNTMVNSASPTGLVASANLVGGFNITSTLIPGSDAPFGNRAWLIQWQSQNAHDGVPVLTASRTLPNTATGVGTGKVTLFDPNFAGIPSGFMDVSIVNTRTGETLTADASNIRSIHVPAGYTHPLQLGDIYKVHTIASFVFGPATWRNREVGDEITNPFPSFEKHSISDVFQSEGRLGVVSDNHCIMSASDDIFNFFRHTATQLLADDLIDVAAASQKPAFFHSAVEWDNKLYLMTDLQVFEVNASGTLLTPETMSLKMVLDVESSRNCRPFPSGRRLFLARSRANTADLSQVLELAHHPQGDGLVFTNTTKHLPTYLAGAPLGLAGDDGHGALFLQTDAGTFYPNFYGGEEGQKTRNSWSSWTFAGATILGMDMYNGVLSLVTTRSDGVYLEYIDLNTAPGGAVVHQDIGSVPYTFTYILSTIFPRRIQRDFTSKVDRLANFHIRYINMRYENTNSFTITSVSPLRPTYSSAFFSAVGASGSFPFGVVGRNVSILVTVSDTSNYPLRFSGLDWEATYSTRSQRL